MSPGSVRARDGGITPATGNQRAAAIAISTSSTRRAAARGERRARAHPLWGEPADVPRKERREADVRRARELGDQPLETDREAAVGRHPVAERLEVRRERLERKPRGRERGDVVVV